MTVEADPAEVPTRPTRTEGRIRDRLTSYYELTKPGIATYVAMVAGVCYYVGTRGEPHLPTLVNTVAGTIVATGGALALNQYIERDVDARMVRTRTRPLPEGRVTPWEALVFGGAMLLLGVVYLSLAVGWLPAALTAASAAAYLWVYTPLKGRSYLATLAGAVPGAFPALIGWTAATGVLSLGGLILFGIAFLWQLPHVLAIAWLLKADFERAGFFMTPPSDPSGDRIGRHMVFHSISLLFLSTFPTVVGITGVVYLVGALVLGLATIATTVSAAVDMTPRRARRVFIWSLLYQPLLLGLLLFDTVGP